MTMKHTRATDVTVLIECVCGHVGQVDADAINSGDAVTLCCTSCGIRQSYRFGIPVKEWPSGAGVRRSGLAFMKP
jgi:hypothetical protein